MSCVAGWGAADLCLFDLVGCLRHVRIGDSIARLRDGRVSFGCDAAARQPDKKEHRYQGGTEGEPGEEDHVALRFVGCERDWSPAVPRYGHTL